MNFDAKAIEIVKEEQNMGQNCWKHVFSPLKRRIRFGL